MKKPVVFETPVFFPKGTLQKIANIIQVMVREGATR